MLAGMCTFLGVYCTQPLLPLLRNIFSASELEVSVTVSATVFGVAVAAPLVGLIAERRGRKKVIVPSLFLLTIPTVLAATSHSLASLIFWRFAQGLFVPGVIAVILAYINEEWAGRGVGRAMSSYVTGTVLGGFLGRFISGIIATHWHWRMTFVVLGLVNLVGAVAVRSWLPKARNFVPAEHFRQALSDAKLHFHNSRLLANFATGATVLFALVGCFTYANFYLAEAPFRLNAAQLGSIFLVYLLGVVITPVSGIFLDRFGFRRTSILYCAMMCSGLALTLSSSLALVITGLAIFSSGVFVAQSAATVQTGVIAGKARSSAAGLYVTFYYLGGSLGATLTGWCWQWQKWRGCVALLAGLSVFSLVMARLSSRPHEVLEPATVDALG
ncbi:MAG TPA: MFS transporter [Candidatus Limnocylindrales bacterium]|nr:MFS transporter [Candidatus Limnocylindrales bacterium]